MKTFTVFIVLCLLLNLSNSNIVPYIVEVKAFRNFKLQYNKSYPTASAELKALTRFIKAFRKIIKYNELFDAGLVDSSMEINAFADMTQAEIDILTTGNIIPDYEFEDFKMRPRDVVIVVPDMFPPGPPAIDWRTKGHVTPPKDQGFHCNSCWAFSAIAALESALSIKYGTLAELSEQYLIDCNRNVATGNWGCVGGSQASAYMNILLAPGIPSSADYPYQERQVHTEVYKCRYNQTTSLGTTTGYGRVRPLNETLLKDVVAAVGPVAFALNGAADVFKYYKGGIINDESCRPGTGHSALIYGYGTAKYKNGTSVDFWLCKNSWSSEWGDKGYFKIARGKNMCGLTSYVIYPIV